MITIDDTKKSEIQNEKAKLNRAIEYKEISDPIFMKYQRGEATKQEWLDAVESIKVKYPYA